MEVSVVTWLVTKMIQLKLRPKIPAPTAPKCACLQEALWGIFRADKLAWDFGVWQLGPAWKLEQQDPASGGYVPPPPPEQMVTSLCALPGTGLYGAGGG